MIYETILNKLTETDKVRIVYTYPELEGKVFIIVTNKETFRESYKHVTIIDCQVLTNHSKGSII